MNKETNEINNTNPTIFGEDRLTRQAFLREPLALTILAKYMGVPVEAIEQDTLNEHNFLWVLYVIGKEGVAKKIAQNPNLMHEDTNVHLLLEATSKDAYFWEQVREEWTIACWGEHHYDDHHRTAEQRAELWKTGALNILEGEQLQVAGEDIKHDVWKRGEAPWEGLYALKVE